jgi:hypothetical protein
MAEMSLTAANKAKTKRADMIALWAGIAFSAVFTGVIWLAGQRLEAVRLLPDAGPAWYYWQLPAPTFWTRATAWGFYLLHQIVLWGLIYYAQANKTRYTTGLHRVNILALAVNVLFIAVHFVQTHIWYDGLAQDTPVWSSQASVIVLLVAVLLMENQRRGLFFGEKAPLPADSVGFWRKYHGYVFSWAIVYTFWFHPMVSTSGHLIGFFYMFLMMLQGSLFFTRIHVNRWWTLVQEITVLIHGALVAVMQGNGIWPMFAFGFAGIFVISQMHGLNLSRPIRWIILALFVGSALWVYSGRGWANLNEIVRIPLIEYVAVFVLAGLTSGILRLVRRLGGPARRSLPGMAGTN